MTGSIAARQFIYPRKLFARCRRLRGTTGVPGDGPDKLDSPSDVVVATNGDIFVTDSHNFDSGNNRVVRYSKDGKFIKAWGKTGYARGEFRMLHSIAIDSRGRVFVADRGNNRIQIFD